MSPTALAAVVLLWVSWALAVAAVLTTPLPPDGVLTLVLNQGSLFAAAAIMACVAVAFTVGRSWARLAVAAVMIVAAAPVLVWTFVDFTPPFGAARVARSAATLGIVASLLSFTSGAEDWFSQPGQSSAA